MSDIDPRFEMLCQTVVQNAKAIARLEAENERLRKALLDVLNLIEHPRDIYEVDVDAIQSVAWRALNR